MNRDYYNEFVALSLQQCTGRDYADQRKIKVHNAASKKLESLQAKLKGDDSTEMLNLLLCHEDDRVKINAAAQCLRINALVDRAIFTLENLVVSSDDPTMRFTAKMILQKFSIV